jgi:hypothetical protein
VLLPIPKPDRRIFVGITAPVGPHIEIQKERDRSFEPGKNWRWRKGDGCFLIEARHNCSA